MGVEVRLIFFCGRSITQAQPLAVQHSIPSLCCALKGCACVLGEIRGAVGFPKISGSPPRRLFQISEFCQCLFGLLAILRGLRRVHLILQPARFARGLRRLHAVARAAQAPPLGRHALPAARRLLLEHCACPVAAHGAVLAARGAGRRFRLAQCLCEVAQRQCPVSLLHCKARASQRLPQARVLRDCCGVGVAHHCRECCRCACLHCNGKLRNGMSQDCCGIQKLSALRSFSDFVAAISYSSVSSDVPSDSLLPRCNGRCRRVRPGCGR